MAFDILGRTEPGTKILQGYLRAKEDWVQAEAHRGALHRLKEPWAKQAVEVLLRRDVKELGPRMNNVFLRARTLTAAAEELSKLDSIDAKVRRLVPRGAIQL